METKDMPKIDWALSLVNPRKFKEIDLLDYDVVNCHPRSDVDDEDIIEASSLLEKTVFTPAFTAPGQRNDQAVNLCIALYVLGWDDPTYWIELFLDKNEKQLKAMGRSQYDIECFKNHVDRVIPYLKDWGPDDNERQALMFAL